MPGARPAGIENLLRIFVSNAKQISKRCTDPVKINS